MEELFTVIKDDEGKVCLYFPDIDLKFGMADEYWGPILAVITLRHKDNVIYFDSKGKTIEGRPKAVKEGLARVITILCKHLKEEETIKYKEWFRREVIEEESSKKFTDKGGS